MASGSITVRSVATLKAGDTLWDGGHKQAVKGFGVRRQKAAAVYVLKCRAAGRQRFITIGQHGSPWTPEQARREAKRLLGLLASGRDPQAEKSLARAQEAQSLKEVAIKYLAYAKLKQKPRSFLETQRHILVGCKPLHLTSIFKITRRDVAKLLTDIQSERGPTSAARARAALSALFNWAIRDGLDISANPVLGTNKPSEPKSRETVLAEPEIVEIWQACRDDDFGRIVRLLLLTGQRRDEVGGMSVDEFNVETRIWTIPAARSKNRRSHTIPLSRAAAALIPTSGDESRIFCFGSGPRRNGGTPRGFSGWSKAKAAVDKSILEKRRQSDPKAEPLHWRLHDLRRTCATMMADKLGILPHIVEAVLNHVSGHKSGVAGVYNRAMYTAEIQEALERWADFLAQLVARPEIAKRNVSIATIAAGVDNAL